MKTAGRVLGALAVMVCALARGEAVPDASLTNFTVVARVDGEEIIRGTIEDYVSSIVPKALFHRNVNEATLARLRAEGLEKTIITILAAREGKKSGLDVSEQVEKVMAQLDQAAQKKGCTVEELLEERKQTLDQLRVALERSELATAYMHAQTSALVQVTEEDARAYFEANRKTYTQPEAVRLQHILVRVPPEVFGGKDVPQQKTAAEIHKRALRGEPFEQLAQLFKEEIANADKLDTGFIHRGSMLSEVEETAFGLQKGEVGPLTVSMYGFHIIKLVDRRDPEPIPFEKVQKAVQEELRKKRVEELRTKVEERLKAGATIEVYWDPATDRLLPGKGVQQP